ncbi:hypothetical protein TESG_08381 [Trichophyton tonsurans CBS 112818]|uniref:Uncharacterized protein n=2 Tax=Trichophyton TaxID=5550 RepID=F2Q2T8_TRIEC|nr:hypothetical protein TESG_08381 [Trichophyton tonsurans CBS 112818]EGE08456.1 hypothetical protein TEQG_08788 [Trichophyton equinum CBS 127.97]
MKASWIICATFAALAMASPKTTAGPANLRRHGERCGRFCFSEMECDPPKWGCFRCEMRLIMRHRGEMIC